jgi:flagellar motor switch protein FliM
MRWSRALRDEIMDVSVEISTKFIEVTLPLQKIMDLKAGDIIPIVMPEHITMLVETLPSFRAKLGQSRNNLALKIESKIKRPESVKSELTILTKGGKRLDSDAELYLLDDYL